MDVKTLGDLQKKVSFPFYVLMFPFERLAHTHLLALINNPQDEEIKPMFEIYFRP